MDAIRNIESNLVIINKVSLNILDCALQRV